jgi:hypothetical protein
VKFLKRKQTRDLCLLSERVENRRIERSSRMEGPTGRRRNEWKPSKIWRY